MTVPPRKQTEPSFCSPNMIPAGWGSNGWMREYDTIPPASTNLSSEVPSQQSASKVSDLVRWDS